MSGRSKRIKNPIQTYANNQARQREADAKKAAEKAAEKAAAKPIKRKRTSESTTVVQKTRKNLNVNPKTKLLNTLAKLRNKEAPRNGLNRYGYTFLASLYRNHPATQLRKYAFNWSNEKQIEFMKKQHTTLTKNTSRINAPSETVNIPMNDEKMHDLLIMLWMDMSHDKLFKGSFNAFLTSSIKNEITKKKIPPKKTELVSKLESYEMLKISNGAIVLMSDIEKKHKKYMHEIWGDPSYPPKIVKKTASILSIVKNSKKPIYVSYDAENSDYITELLAKTRMTDGTYYLKRIFTVANLMDPGRGASANVGGFGKSGGSINKLVNRLFDEQNTSTPFKFNYQMFKFNFGNYFTIEIVPDGYKFNAKLNGKMLNMQIKRIDAAISGNVLDKISKTFGDFIQILTVAHLRKSGLNVVSSTQDGGFVGMTGFVHGNLFDIEPALISDSTTVIGTGNSSETGIKFYGLHKYLRYNTDPTRSGVTTKQNNESNAKSQQKTGTPKRVNARQGFLARIFGGNKKRNNTQSPKFKPQTPRTVNTIMTNANNNTRSFVTASSNNSNNNNNNVGQPTKKRKVNNNVQARLNRLTALEKLAREKKRLA
jgi:hypothetical protein